MPSSDFERRAVIFVTGPILVMREAVAACATRRAPAAMWWLVQAFSGMQPASTAV
jgi:hypothetical protein